MCGINGIVCSTAQNAPERSSLEAMNEALFHRGPDDGGVWTNEVAGLAARRLSIRDVDHGHQPMVSEGGRLVVSFNGEIYNYDECRRDLEAKGYTFRTRCDTELLLHGYAAYGDELPNRLNGMFAFAAYDTDRRRLFLARDRLGIKPLFYAHVGDALIFSSELDALMKSGRVRGAINASALDAYFTYLYVPAPDTIYRGVHKLRPAETLVFEKGETGLNTYWRPDYTIDPTWTLDSAAESFDELFRDAVNIRRVSDVPLGAFLSGGLDSSSVVAVLSEQSGEPVKSFSIGFKDREANELPYARKAAEAFGTDHHEAVLDPDIVELSSRIARYFGEPFADSSAIPMWLVAQTARESVTVALSGDGGDELFAGYTWAHMHRRVRQYARLPSVLRTVADGLLRFAPDSPSVRKLRRFSGDSFSSHREGFRRRLTCFSPEERRSLYMPDIAKAVQEEGVDYFHEIADRAPQMSEDDWMLYQDLHMYLPDDVLTKVDRMTMAHSLEARVPFLDHRLVEFAATVPFSLKYDAGVSKRLVKKAMAQRLPEELTGQRKRGFAIPIHRWFREDLAGYFAETVLGGDSRCTELLDEATIKGLLRDHTEGRENRGHQLWAILMFEQWLRSAKVEN